MRRHMRLLTLGFLYTVRVVLALAAMPALVAAGGVDNAQAALQKLYASQPVARRLGEQVKAILVFPKIVKAGFLVGGQYGSGALVQKGTIVGHYNSVAASYGLQAGMQWFGYVLFLMNDKAFAYLDKSDGWELGVGPSIVVVDQGKAKAMTSTTLRDDVYAFIFNQKGLMGGLGLQGSKITQTSP